MFYSLAFWKAASLFVAGLLALLGYFDFTPDEWVVGPETVLLWVLGLLQMFGIEPELRLKAMAAHLRRTEELLRESAVLRNDLLDRVEASKKDSKNKSK